MKYIVLGCVLFCIIFSLNAQTSKKYEEKLYELFLQNKVNEWDGVIEDLDEVFKETRYKNVLITLTRAQYGYIGHLLTSGQKKKIPQHLPAYKKNIDLLLKTDHNKSESYAMLATYWAYELANAKHKIRKLGPLSVKNIDKSIELNPNMPYGWTERGNSTFHMPALFGGSKTEAIQYYQKAVLLYEKQKLNQKNWLYLNALITLAEAYKEIEEYNKAKSTFSKILQIEPNFPEIHKRLNSL